MSVAAKSRPSAALLKGAALVFLLLPPLTLLPAVLAGEFAARPWEQLLNEAGGWALWFLLATLAVTPLRRIGHWPRLALVRRRLGVGCFCYAAFHLLAFVGDQGFQLDFVAGEILQRLYLTLGFMALLILLALAITSTDAMLRRLGGRRWQRLHWLVYPAALLAVVHFFLQTKLDQSEPALRAGLLLWLLAYRVVHWQANRGGRRRDLGVGVLLLLALGSGLATALLEALVLWLGAGAPLERVLAANLSLAVGLRPGWSVLLAGLAMALLGLWRGRAKAALRARRPAAATT